MITWDNCVLFAQDLEWGNEFRHQVKLPSFVYKSLLSHKSQYEGYDEILSGSPFRFQENEGV